MTRARCVAVKVCSRLMLLLQASLPSRYTGPAACDGTPASWRIVATNLLTRKGDTAQEVTAPPPPPAPEPAPVEVEKRPVSNFVLNISGEDHPIQVGNPLVVTIGSKRVKIVLRNPGHSN